MTTEAFNTFHDVQHLPLRVYNRVVTAYNIKEDFGTAILEEYFENFSAAEKWQMFNMMEFIKRNGREAAKAFATKDLVIQDEQIAN